VLQAATQHLQQDLRLAWVAEAVPVPLEGEVPTALEVAPEPEPVWHTVEAAERDLELSSLELSQGLVLGQVV
jgi:hypothetical protein